MRRRTFVGREQPRYSRSHVSVSLGLFDPWCFDCYGFGVRSGFHFSISFGRPWYYRPYYYDSFYDPFYYDPFVYDPFFYNSFFRPTRVVIVNRFLLGPRRTRYAVGLHYGDRCGGDPFCRRDGRFAHNGPGVHWGNPGGQPGWGVGRLQHQNDGPPPRYAVHRASATDYGTQPVRRGAATDGFGRAVQVSDPAPRRSASDINDRNGGARASEPQRQANPRDPSRARAAQPPDEGATRSGRDAQQASDPGRSRPVRENPFVRRAEPRDSRSDERALDGGTRVLRGGSSASRMIPLDPQPQRDTQQNQRVANPRSSRDSNPPRDNGSAVRRDEGRRMEAPARSEPTRTYAPRSSENGGSQSRGVMSRILGGGSRSQGATRGSSETRQSAGASRSSGYTRGSSASRSSGGHASARSGSASGRSAKHN